MNVWPYVIASYVITLGGAAMIVGLSWASMRRAERAVEELRER